ncbi:MAG: class I SAM-dependent methyltransferase [Victivallales bacterium]|nr:class I SAM-dependent methyltransferase [Victivallales bacterium]
MKAETVMDFDRSARDWDQNPLHAERNRAIADAVIARVSLHGKMRALEFGCGTGELTLRLAPHVGSVLATDASGGMIEQLEGKLTGSAPTGITPRQLDLLAGSLPEGPFDLIYSAMTLHHIDDVALLFRQLVGLLAAGGQVAVADLCAEDGSFHGDVSVPHLGFSQETLGALVAPAGLALRSCEEVYDLAKKDASYPVFLAILEREGGE